MNDGETNVLDGVTNSLGFLFGGFKVGDVGSNTGLILTNGTLLTNSGSTFIGYNSTANSNYIFLTGSGTRWLIGYSDSAEVRVGNAGSYNLLVISNGAGITNVNYASIGTGTKASNNLVFIVGAGSGWSNFGGLEVGGSGSFNQLVIDEGGFAASSSGDIGSFGVGNLVSVAGEGSRWKMNGGPYMNGGLYIGKSGSINTLLVSNRGFVTGTFCTVGNSANAKSNSVVVAGSGSVWSNSSDLTVGYKGAFNQMIISNGGLVFSATGSLGEAASNSSNNSVVVTGSGSSWINSGSLTIGNTGPLNQMIVNNGGSVTSSKLIVGGNGSSNNLLWIDDGFLIVTNSATNALLDVAHGTLTLRSGILAADSIRVANGTNSQFNFNGGTMNVRTTLATNGVIIFVGDGTSPATLNLVGNGTHTFADGLQLSSNATLTGNGTVLGNVTNFGTLTPGGFAGALAFGGDLRLRASSVLSLKLGGVAASNNYDFIPVANLVEFGGSLSLPLINDFVPAWSNRFTLMTYSDATGAFSNVASGARLPVGTNGGTMRVLYNDGSLRAGDYRLDADGDGVDDGWAQFYFGHSPLSVLEKSADADGDGRSNLDEYLAGTDPLNAESSLAITSLVLDAAGNATLQFRWVPDRAYRLEYSDVLSSWNVVSNAVLTFPEANKAQWVDDGSLTGGLASPVRMYRVGVLP